MMVVTTPTLMNFVRRLGLPLIWNTTWMDMSIWIMISFVDNFGTMIPQMFVLEEKNALDIILALLLAAFELFAKERDNILDKYVQNEPGLNKPVLSIMQSINQSIYLI